METAKSIEARASRLIRALEAAFGLRADTLEQALRRAGRRLPRRLHVQAQRVVAAQRYGGHPKRMLQVDVAALDAAEEAVLGYLATIDRADQRKGAVLGWAGALVFNLLLVVALFILWMWWAGHL